MNRDDEQFTTQRIVGTIVGRVLQEDEIVQVGWLILVTLAIVAHVIRFDQSRAGRIAANLRRCIVPLFQIGAHLAEFGQSGPTGANVTGSGHSVTLALMSHHFLNCL